MTKNTLILASGSTIRAQILSGAGVAFAVRKSDVDEDVIKKDGLAQHHDCETIALALAKAKALAKSGSDTEFILGSDQILEFEGTIFDKPETMEAAKQRLSLLAGKPHRLINATVLAHKGKIVWQNIDSPTLYVRTLTETELDRYFSAADPSILHSVGGYQVEGLGSRLFERIDGDYFAVLGLALMPLLAALRTFEIIEF